MQDKFNSI